jgi:UDP-N-acetylglucosamine 2-epimerase (non-hydrolysing)
MKTKLAKPTIVTVVGTRPEIIRLSRTIPKLDTNFEQVLVNTMQNSHRNLNESLLEELGVRTPDFSFRTAAESLGGSIGGILSGVEKVLIEKKPAAMVVLGDTNSALSAIMAKRMGIPVYHLEAGNRSFDENVPEETNRRIVDHVSDFNLPYGEHARRNLLREGLPTRRIFTTGSPMKEVLDYYKPRIDASTAVDRLELTHGQYFLVSAHRQENVDNPIRFRALLEALEDLHKTWGIPVVVSTHPRTQLRVNESGIESRIPGIRFHEPFGFFDYVRLQQGAKCVLSDSGTISEEAAILGFPAVTIRDSMERPEALENGTIALAGIGTESILPGVHWAISREGSKLSSGPDSTPLEYQESGFSDRVLGVLLSTFHLHRDWLGLR